jgi:hypothetical protein
MCSKTIFKVFPLHLSSKNSPSAWCIFTAIFNFQHLIPRGITVFLRSFNGDENHAQNVSKHDETSEFSWGALIDDFLRKLSTFEYGFCNWYFFETCAGPLLMGNIAASSSFSCPIFRRNLSKR